jgi:hypothetical protein
VALIAQQFEQFLQSYKQLGGKGAFCTDVVSLSGDALKGLGQAADNYYVTSAFPPPNASSDNPGIKQYLADMAAARAAGVKDAKITSLQTGLVAWAGMQVIKQVGSTLEGPITAAGFYQALQTAKVSIPGLLPSLDFGAKPLVASYPRLQNWAQELDKWNVDKGEFETVVPSAQLDVSSLNK